jgi:tetratricopeptide (TPR) repeat protein
MTLGVNCYNSNDYPNSLNYLNKAIQNNSKHPHLFEIRANVKEDFGDLQGAIDDYKESLRLSGSDWYSIYNQIAVNYLNLKQFEKALTAFDIAIDLKNSLGLPEDNLPNYSDGVVMKVDAERMYTNRANTKLSLKDYQGCMDDCKIAIQINPKYSNSYLVLGLLFYSNDQNENSYKFLKQSELLGNRQASLTLNKLFG